MNDIFIPASSCLLRVMFRSRIPLVEIRRAPFLLLVHDEAGRAELGVETTTNIMYSCEVSDFRRRNFGGPSSKETFMDGDVRGWGCADPTLGSNMPGMGRYVDSLRLPREGRDLRAWRNIFNGYCSLHRFPFGSFHRLQCSFRYSAGGQRRNGHRNG